MEQQQHQAMKQYIMGMSGGLGFWLKNNNNNNNNKKNLEF